MTKESTESMETYSAEKQGKVEDNSGTLLEYRTDSKTYAHSDNKTHKGLSLKKRRGESVTDNEISELEMILSEKVVEGEIPSSELTRNPHNMKKLNYLNAILEEFYENPEKYSQLKSFLKTKGYTIRDPIEVHIYDDWKEAVARTDAETYIGINTHFEALIAEMAEKSSIPEPYIVEMIIAHELVHMAQPYDVLRAEPQPFPCEIDVEQTLREYFDQKAFTTGDMQYARLSTLTHSRYLENKLMMYDKDKKAA